MLLLLWRQVCNLPIRNRQVSGENLPPRTVALWLILAVALAVRTLHRPVTHTLFPLFAQASAHWWADLPLYAPYAAFDYFRYPPLFAVVFTPLALLGPVLGGILWSWLSLAVYFVGLRRFARDVLPVEWTPARESAFLILSLAGALAGLWNAQSNALMVGLLLLGCSAVVRQRWWTAAALLAAPVVLKLTPLPLVLLLCALWPRRLGWRFACLTALGLLLPFVTRPPAIVWEQYRGWFAHLIDLSGGRWPGFRDGWTVWVVLRHVAAGGAGVPDLRQVVDSVWYPVLQMVGGLAVLAGCLSLRLRLCSARGLVTATLALGSGWLMLLGPAVEPPTYVFLAPLLAWAFLDRDAWPGGRVLIAAAVVLVMVLGWSALTRPLWNVAPWLAAALPLGSSLFLAWAAGYCLRQARPYRRDLCSL